MSGKFTDRFDIQVPVEVARQRFVNRVANEIYDFAHSRLTEQNRSTVARFVATELGQKFRITYLPNFVGDEFSTNLQAVEALYASLRQLGYVELAEGIAKTVTSLLA